MFCPRCSAPLRWQYKDFAIPLDGLATWGTPDAPVSHRRATPVGFTDAYDARVLRHLRREAADGWEPAEPIDFTTAWTTDRVQFERRWGLLDLLFGSVSYQYIAVTIRLRRLVS
ncbi:MAG TPA: hypothetical protein VKZ60_15375 [Chloroflexota bacterium]|nr:hypothetical protein [Chloroflexota bacterium]